ncbi:hypothetical protein [Streptomyces phaeolivaceus]|uniref:hypothetical protein n=1 Tax=Streptomyces phaeolivaceus TaxID=2653200 RepID=UPI00186A512A|nr:hypothetical protein [Streptomyces phaeolivaceus]
MSDMVTTSRAVVDGAWPWEQPVAGAHRLRAARECLSRLRRLRRLSEVWSLFVATTVLLAGGYALLGSVAGGAPGAVIGAVAGVSVSALLYLAVDRAISGTRRHRRTARRQRHNPSRMKRR